MSVVSLRHSRALIWGALAAFVLFVTPAGLPAKASGTAPAGASLAAESGALSGFVYGKDVRTPVAGAVVKIRNIADMKEMASAPTDANGMYAISGVPEGRYLMGVTSAQGDYNLDYALYVKGGELGKLSISLAAVTEGVQSGEAATKKKGFFNSVAGRVLVVAAVGVGLYFLIAGGEEASPIR
jgi:hypothetical protein